MVDESGIIRARGRLAHVRALNRSIRTPIIIRGKSPWAALFIRHVHCVTFQHMAGLEQTLAEVRKTIWIIRGREAVKRVLRQGVHCRRLRATVVTQQMGPIRVPGEQSYAFQFTAIDAAGPFLTKMPRGYVQRKCYLLVFTCCTFRCVHLEVMNGLDTQLFLLAFERFLARQNRPQMIAMDNGTNFVGGTNELIKSWQKLGDERLQEKYEITFKFNVPLAPHRNGLVERIIGSAKRALLHVIKPDANVNDEQLSTAFNMVESILNARPLTYVGSDLRDLEPLTPEHFLGKTKAPAQGTTQASEDAHVDLDQQFKSFRETLRHVIRRFAAEYVPGLQPRGKWKKKLENLREGAVVTAFDSSSPKYWPLAVITRVYKGKDGLVRTVILRMANGREYERDVRHVCLLLSGEEDTDTDNSE